MEPLIEFNGSIIYAVPAVHYRSLFAREVNNLCSSEETRPDAVAVELGPCMAGEIAAWMRELGVNPFSETELPCMLGILVKNRLIHPDFSETALCLQEYSGKPLNEISPMVKKQLLHFSDKYLAGLSSTDSIIEAIRCAIELNIPVYGIDMDEYSVKPNTYPLIKEPVFSNFNLSYYVSQNGEMASGFMDPYVDGRREHVMAARLKCISGKHKRILFTGGLAHWEMIKGLMANPAVRPAEILIPDGSLNFTRVIIHPGMAVTFMDIYPVLTTIYELKRHNPALKGNYPFNLQEPYRLYQDIILKVYRKYLKEPKTDLPENMTGTVNQRIPDFERLLTNLQLVHQHFAPSMTEMIDCAMSMMPPCFCAALISQLMDIERSWSSPEQYPDLPVISKIHNKPEKGDNNLSVDLFQQYEGGGNKKLPGQPRLQKSVPFTLKYHQANPLPEHLLSSWKWENEPEGPCHQVSYFDWVWPPCEALLFGSAYEASRMAVTRSNEPVSSPFEGSLYDGIDVKATIRSVIKGEKKIYIRKPSSAKKTFIPDGKKPEPSVFIFGETPADIKPAWSLLIAGTNLRSYIRDKSAYDETVRKYGDCFVSSISRVFYQEAPSQIKNYVDSYSMLEGITAFGSPCINARQGAQWVEDNDFSSCPVLNYTSIEALIDFYRKHHNMDISESDWKTALIRFAIPYAKERVVVIAPGNFKPSVSLFSEARRRNISIDLLPLSYFPASRIFEMRQRIMVRAKDSDGFTFPTEVEKALG
ncbi:MAG: hypothetical protein E4H43_03545, partial [Bacteroidia bacterium]